MKTTKLSKIIDFIFGTILVFSVAFLWCRFYIHNLGLTILIASTTTFFICSIFYFINSKKKKKKSLTIKEENNAILCANNFMFMTKKECLTEWKTLLKTKYNVLETSNFLKINNNFFVPYFYVPKLTEIEVLNTYVKLKSLAPEKIILCCKSIDNSAYEMAKAISQTKIVLLDQKETYNQILKPLNYSIPKVNVIKLDKKTKWNNFFLMVFNKKRAKGYVLSALILLIASFVMRYNIYYLIWATFLTILSLVSYYNQKFNPKENINIL